MQATQARLGLLGHQIAYSLSPLIHQTSGHFLSKNCSYELFDLPTAALAGFLKDFWQAGGLGLNVTKPHKRAVAQLLGDDRASFNTLYRGPHSWLGTSTDAQGFALGLSRLSLDLVACSELVILGNGGVVSALVTYLRGLKRAPSLTILRRSPQFDDLLRLQAGASLRLRFLPFSPADLQQALPLGDPAALLIQASSAPAHGEDLAAFVPALAGFTGTFCDLLYDKPSALLAAARLRGLRCQDGLPMLIEQARLSQLRWWGEAAPYELLEKTLLAQAQASGRI